MKKIVLDYTNGHPKITEAPPLAKQAITGVQPNLAIYDTNHMNWMKDSGALQACHSAYEIALILSCLDDYGEVKWRLVASWLNDFKIISKCASGKEIWYILETLKNNNRDRIVLILSWIKEYCAEGYFTDTQSILDTLTLFGNYRPLLFYKTIRRIHQRGFLERDILGTLLKIYALDGLSAAIALLTEDALLPDHEKAYPLYVASLGTKYETVGLRRFIEEKQADQGSRRAILAMMTQIYGANHEITQQHVLAA